MKPIGWTRGLALIVGGIAAAAAGAAAGDEVAAGRVAVRFFEPETFTDLREAGLDFENERGRAFYLPLFQKHLEQRAPRYLKEGERLELTFTDIDLAGEFEPGRGLAYYDVRIVRDRYLPRLAFQFRVTAADGTVVKEGERRLADGSFMIRGAGMDNDSLRYEKAMLDDWMRREFRRAKD